jgi:hypothetical protein
MAAMHLKAELLSLTMTMMIMTSLHPFQRMMLQQQHHRHWHFQREQLIRHIPLIQLPVPQAMKTATTTSP